MKHYSNVDLTEVVDYLEKHHVVLKEKMVKVSQLLEQMIVRYEDKYGRIFGALRDFFAEIKPEMERHFDKEERILFPYIRQVDGFVTTGGKPDFNYGSIKNPIGLIEYEHDRIENVLLINMRAIVDNYTLPPDAREDLKRFYDSVQDTEKELREHIYIENNVLFPQAIETEMRLMHSR